MSETASISMKVAQRIVLMILLAAPAACERADLVSVPLAELRLGELDPSITRLTISTIITSAEGHIYSQTDVFREYPFDVVGVRFPSGTRGLVNFSIFTYRWESCLAYKANESVRLEADEVIRLNVILQPQGQSCSLLETARVEVDLRNAGGSDSVESDPLAIRCYKDPEKGRCSILWPIGFDIKLRAISKNHPFVSWSSEAKDLALSCSGLSDPAECSFTVKADTKISATFR